MERKLLEALDKWYHSLRTPGEDEAFAELIWRKQDEEALKEGRKEDLNFDDYSEEVQ